MARRSQTSELPAPADFTIALIQSGYRSPERYPDFGLLMSLLAVGSLYDGGSRLYRSREKLTLTRSVSEDATHVLAYASG